MATRAHHRTNGRSRANVSAAANQLLREGRKLANEMYADGLRRVNHKVNKVEENFKDYSDGIITKIQDNPLTSVLIAGGIGFLLSKIFKK